MKKKLQKDISVILLGDTGVGKTSIFIRYCKNKFTENYISTISADFERKNIERHIPRVSSEWEKIDAAAVLQTLQNLYKNLMTSFSDTKILDVYEEISVNEKITLMTELMEKNGHCMFSELLTRKKNRLDMICAFMAVLEAVKFRLAVIYQNALFADIKICPRKDDMKEIA